MTIREHVRSLLPSPRDYVLVPRSWRGDLVAGVTVGIIALPLALAFGVSAGVGPEAGLVTAIIAGVVAAIFGGSNVQVSGPTGAMVVVLAPIVAVHGASAVAVVCVLAGIIVIVAGALRLGRVVSVIPWPVIEGFTLGIAIIIFLQQVPTALGAPAVHTGGSTHSTNALVAAVQAVLDADPSAAMWSLAAVGIVAVVMLVLPRIHRGIPASLIAIIVVTVPMAIFGLPGDRIGELPSALFAPRIPVIEPSSVLQLVPAAFAVAALAAIESLLSARVASTIAPTGVIQPDRELVGQGLASLAAGFFGGMPATGAIARTAVNVRSGARTRVAAVVHALVLVFVVLVAAPLVSVIPLAALAGVLMVTAVRMVSPGSVRAVVTASRGDAIIFCVTALVTVAFDLIVAVIIGVAVAGLLALRHLARSASVEREPLPGQAQPGDERIALYRISGPLFFGAAEAILEEVGAVEGISVVVVRLSKVDSIDATGARAITDLVVALQHRGVVVLLKGVRPEHVTLAERVGMMAALSNPRHRFDSLDDAVEHARDHVRRENASTVTR